MPPVVSIVGRSKSGKTTLVERLVAEMKKRGYRIGTIKHDVHGFEIDHRGKDSYRHFHAGADATVISGPNKIAAVKRTKSELEIDEIISSFLNDVDIVLTEGYKSRDKPKIEVIRSPVGMRPLCKPSDNLIAIATDADIDIGVPRFHIDDVAGIADFLVKRFLSPAHR